MGINGSQLDIPSVRRDSKCVRVHTCVMRESDFRDAAALLVRLKHLARPNLQAALILDRVKQYLANQFDRGDRPYILPAELAVAGTTTFRFFPREADTHPSIASPKNRAL
jgi:hypothetical protein